MEKEEKVPIGQALETNAVVDCFMSYPEDAQRKIADVVRLERCSEDVARLMLFVFAQNKEYVIEEVRRMFRITISGCRVWGETDINRGTFFCRYIAEKLVTRPDGSFYLPLISTQHHCNPKPVQKAS